MKEPYYQHRRDYYRLSIPNGFHEDPRYIRWSAPLPLFVLNGLFVEENLTPAAVEDNLAYFQERNLPNWWILHEQGEMAQQLEEKGYQSAGEITFVKRELSAPIPPLRHNPRVEAKRVECDRDMKIWSELVFGTFFPTHPKEAAALAYDSYRRVGYNKEAPFSHYLGYLDGEPVGGGTLLMSPKVGLGGLWNGAVIEKARCNGVGSAIATARIQEAIARGAQSLTTVLMPDGMAWAYCKPLGFTEAFRCYPYIS